jgi:hypothetical protein
MPGDSLNELEKVVVASLPTDRRPTEAELLSKATAFRQIYEVTEDQFEQLIRRLHARLAITMDEGTILVEEDFVPWLADRKADIDTFYWERLRAWLGRRDWPPLVVNTLDRVTDDILDTTGDPHKEGTWKRRGLVVGDVQSGKTATYTALCCKAADAGFRLIILLTGTLESLRRQTQERLDEGFVGLDSSDFLQGPQVRLERVIGAGELDRRRMAGVFTSRSKDFNRQFMTAHNYRLDAFSEPILLVLKKNKRILENLELWLKSYNAGPDGKISRPLLLIDDEADSASINTSGSTTSPTAINERIRSLLALFHRSSYVGFTATPFANVFIDPDTADTMIGDDLFPRDFIYALEAPTNYRGPPALFGDPLDETLRYIEDADATFPAGHKSSHSVTELPPSLAEAVRSFMLATTIRDLRQEGPTHRSMLVNVSRFTAVQDQVAGLIDAGVRDLQRDIRNFAGLTPQEALAVPSLAELHDTFQREFANEGFTWAEVQASLNTSLAPVNVRAVNQRSGAASLDYKAHKDTGLRVIAVGGNSLSRGLTLEGLSTSYFYRNSQMYDTLLQMGRWFGYRDGYESLCRLWLTEEAALWYAHITRASDELRRELKKMRRLDLTPKDFGLKVRAHPDSLIVTARNKMRLARTIARAVSLDGAGVETARLRSNAGVIAANAEVTSRFVQELVQQRGQPARSPWGSLVWSRVPKEAVAAFLAEFGTHPLNYDFQAEELSEYLAGTVEEKLQHWDIAIPNGSLPDETFGGVSLKPLERRIVVRRDNQSLLVSGSSARVGSRGVEREGLTAEQVEAVRLEYEGKNVSDSAYREVRERPLLLLHLVRGFLRKPNRDKVPFEAEAPPLVALGLSFPRFDDSDVRKKVIYKINLVKWRELFEEEEDDDVPEDDDLD